MTDRAEPALQRRLGPVDATVLGLSAMIGAGVFAVFGPAAHAAGPALLLALALAAIVAYCNAVASAQLAAQFPTSGGTYTYGRELLGPWAGFTAGWGFVVGKTASCAAMASTAASYAVPGHPWAQRGVAAVAVVALVALNLRGISRTAAVARVLLTLTVAVVLAVVVTVWATGPEHAHDLSRWWAAPGVHGVLQGAGLLFFALAGYARIATLGEEVRRPERTIPRAVQTSLAIAVVLYLAVAVSVVAAVGVSALAGSSAPLAAAVGASGLPAAEPVVRAGAVVASLGALLALLAGVGRTGLAMAREGDLPRALARVDPRHHVPRTAELALAVLVVVLVLTVDLRDVIGFSSFGVLVYYAIANAAAARQPRSFRRWPRALQAVGFAGCAALVVSLPAASTVAGVVVFALGLGGRWLAHRPGRVRG